MVKAAGIVLGGMYDDDAGAEDMLPLSLIGMAVESTRLEPISSRLI
jgi:hypothetical protein